MDRIDPRTLLEFAKSESQTRALEAVIKHGSNTKAADALGINRRGLDKTIKRIEGYAAAKGVAPHREPSTPDRRRL